MILILEFIILIVVFVATLFWYVNRTPPNFPPIARISFPILGHFPYFEKYEKLGTQKLFMEWSKKCNSSLIGVDFANYRTVVINDAKTIKHVLSQPASAGRMSVPGLTVRGGNDGQTRGLIFSFGGRWTEQRRFSLRHLKELGFGKKSMENIIMTEAENLIDDLVKDAGKPISTTTRFNAAVVNSFWQICAGERFQHDDPKLAELVSAIIQNLQGTKVIGTVIFMHWFCKLFPSLSGWNTYVENFNTMNNYLKKCVESRMANRERGVINDFIDVYIEEILECTDPTSSFYGEEGKKNFLNCLGDIFSAGSETTSTSMSWICLYLATSPKIQDEVHAEIDRVIGQYRLPSLGDRESLPFVEAVIEETLRMSSVVSLAVFHEAMEDIHVNQYVVPKQTILVPNIYGANHDPKVWGADADEFNPDRFLSPDRTRMIKNDLMLAFSTGRRICIGESLARNELFLLTASIFQKFNISTDPNSPLPSLSPNFGGTVAGPHHHTLIFTERFH